MKFRLGLLVSLLLVVGLPTPDEAEAHALVLDDDGVTTRSIVQVDRLGGAVVVYQPYGFRTTGERKSYVEVARKGELVRAFKVHRKPPKQGALPEEKGLGFGRRDRNAFATAWAFTERVSLIHISEKWFQGDHPTYLLKGGGF